MPVPAAFWQAPCTGTGVEHAARSLWTFLTRPLLACASMLSKSRTKVRSGVPIDPSRSPGSNLARLELDFPQSRPVHGRELFRVRCLLPSTWLKKRKNWGDKKELGTKGGGKGLNPPRTPSPSYPQYRLLACLLFCAAAFSLPVLMINLSMRPATPSHDFVLTT